MKLVIDANIGLSALLPEADTPKALQLSADFLHGNHELLAPDLYLLEVGNTLVNAARSGKIPQNGLPVMFAELMRTLPIIYQSAALFPRAYAIASSIRVSVYDAVYLALSEREGCPLVSNDTKLANTATGFTVVSLDSV
ncbi:MAG: type II toxin-antitoxin system VapC family toxin [Planctomycetota bacterium]|nr:type II toxin-antitoxin system VapC family toxin [Planctomycetota bacterium]